LVRDRNPDLLLLCGDLTSPEVLLACRPSAPRLAFCLGNCDRHRAEALLRRGEELDAAGFDALGILPLPEGGSMAFSHFPAAARRAALDGRHLAVFYGHTHKPAEERLAAPHSAGAITLLANPGDVEGRFGRVGGLLWDSLAGTLDWFQA